MNNKFLTEKSRQVYEANVKKGFYEDKKNIGEMLALIHSEVSEVLEAHRNDDFTEKGIIQDLFCETEENFIHIFKTKIQDTFEDEVADIVIRCLDLCGYLQIDISKHVEAKIRYNSTRPFKHGKRY